MLHPLGVCKAAQCPASFTTPKGLPGPGTAAEVCSKPQMSMLPIYCSFTAALQPCPAAQGPDLTAETPQCRTLQRADVMGKVAVTLVLILFAFPCLILILIHM